MSLYVYTKAIVSKIIIRYLWKLPVFHLYLGIQASQACCEQVAVHSFLLHLQIYHLFPLTVQVFLPLLLLQCFHFDKQWNFCLLAYNQYIYIKANTTKCVYYYQYHFWSSHLLLCGCIAMPCAAVGIFWLGTAHFLNVAIWNT